MATVPYVFKKWPDISNHTAKDFFFGGITMPSVPCIQMGKDLLSML